MYRWAGRENCNKDKKPVVKMGRANMKIHKSPSYLIQSIALPLQEIKIREKGKEGEF